MPVGCSWDLVVVVDNASAGDVDDELAVTASSTMVDVASAADAEEVLVMYAAVDEVRNVVGCCEELAALLMLVM